MFTLIWNVSKLQLGRDFSVCVLTSVITAATATTTPLETADLWILNPIKVVCCWNSQNGAPGCSWEPKAPVVLQDKAMRGDLSRKLHFCISTQHKRQWQLWGRWGLGSSCILVFYPRLFYMVADCLHKGENLFIDSLCVTIFFFFILLLSIK